MASLPWRRWPGPGPHRRRRGWRRSCRRHRPRWHRCSAGPGTGRSGLAGRRPRQGGAGGAGRRCRRRGPGPRPPQAAEDLVADGESGDTRADLLDHAGIVAAEDDREGVLGHAVEIPAAMKASMGLVEEAWTRTSSWPGPAWGSGRSSRSPGGRSKLSRVKARISECSFRWGATGCRGRTGPRPQPGPGPAGRC
jgi:hypothetical protein